MGLTTSPDPHLHRFGCGSIAGGLPAGRRPGPAEDCGGVCGYELIAAATDPTHADHADAVAEYARHFGLDADPASLRLPRSTSMRSTTLVDLDLDDTTSQIDLPEPLDELSTR